MEAFVRCDEQLAVARGECNTNKPPNQPSFLGLDPWKRALAVKMKSREPAKTENKAYGNAATLAFPSRHNIRGRIASRGNKGKKRQRRCPAKPATGGIRGKTGATFWCDPGSTPRIGGSFFCLFKWLRRGHGGHFFSSSKYIGTVYLGEPGLLL